MELKDKILEYYNKWGYTRTIEYLRELSGDGVLVLTERAKLQEMITELEVTPKRKRK